MLSFVESPGTALRAAGIPIQLDCLTKRDCDRLTRVLGKLRNLVKEGKIAKDFRFEDIFTIAANVAYEHQDTSSDSYSSKNFDHSADGTESDSKSSTESGIYTKFTAYGIARRNGDDIIAPLISPGDFAAIATLMHAKINAVYEK